MASLIDEAEFRAIYELHFDAVARYCLRRLPEHLAHDATSEVFMVLWRRLDEAPAGEQTLPWLYAVARNVVRNADRTTRRTVRLRARLLREPRDDAPTPEAIVVRNEQDAQLLSALARLRPADREILRLRALERLTFAQIATVLSCTESAARKRAGRATARLRRGIGSSRAPDRFTIPAEGRPR